MPREMSHDLIDNRESYLADKVRPLLSQSVRAHFGVGLAAEPLVNWTEALL
jgi:hypothetical protein